MSFDWYETKAVPSPRGERAARRLEMYRGELRERAALLHRLNYSKAKAKGRLRANVSWDFELHERPAFASQIDAIVDEVYGRGKSSG